MWPIFILPLSPIFLMALMVVGVYGCFRVGGVGFFFGLGFLIGLVVLIYKMIAGAVGIMSW